MNRSSSASTYEVSKFADFSSEHMLAYIRTGPQNLSEIVEERTKNLFESKSELKKMVRGNYILQQKLDELDTKIEMLIRNRVSLEEVEHSHRVLMASSVTRRKIDRTTKQTYGQLFYLLQQNPKYLSRLARQIQPREVDNFIQTTVLTLFGDEFGGVEEKLLLQLFDRVLIQEFELARGDMGSFMRSNTVITRMLSLYARRPGSLAALKELLGEVVGEIANSQQALEINPSKVYLGIINDYEIATGSISPLPRQASPEECAANADVQALVNERSAVITGLCERVLDRIVTGVDHIPFGIRWLCRRLKELSLLHFPDATPQQVNGIVGGFVFLRFFNPSIVGPDAVNIVANKPTPAGRRNLVFIAKVLQNMSNGVLFAGKERFMAVFNHFLEAKQEAAGAFFERLVHTPDVEDVLAIDAYLHDLSEITVTLSFNEIAQMHTVVLRHLDVLTSDERDDPLVDVANRMGPPPEMAPQSENDSITLELLAPPQDANKLSRLSVWDRSITPDKVAAQATASALAPIEETQEPHRKSQTPEEQLAIFLEPVLRSMPLLDGALGPFPVSPNHDVALSTTEPQHVEASPCPGPALTELLRRGVMGAEASADFVAQAEIDGVAEALGCGEQRVRMHRRVLEQVFEHYAALHQRHTRGEPQWIKLSTALEALNEHHELLQDRLDMYGQVLQMTRQKLASSKKKSKNNKKKKKKFTHKQLVEMGVIVHSNVPGAAQGSVSFNFFPNDDAEGSFTITATVRSVEADTCNIFLDDLLEQQERNLPTLDIDQVTLNVNMLIHLLNKNFLTG